MSTKKIKRACAVDPMVDPDLNVGRYSNANVPRKKRTTLQCTCNLCGKDFKGITRFDRFCGSCRASEAYRNGSLYERQSSWS
jgi:hypothetical protein